MDIIGNTQYTAYSFNESELVIFAVGINPTPGYKNDLIYDGENYQLDTCPPEEIAPDVLAMFYVLANFETGGEADQITIEDAHGLNQISVTKLSHNSEDLGLMSDTRCSALHLTHGSERCATRCTKKFGHISQGEPHKCANGHRF